MNNRFKVVGLAAVLGMLSGCGGPDEYKPAEGMVAKDIYIAACQSCHGENGSGKLGFLLKIAGRDYTAEEVAHKIGEGGFIMPSFPNIAEAERKAVGEYVEALK